MIGKTLSHYEILDRIGVGGMGEVYRARDTQLDREVAIKVLPPGLGDNPERLQRFEQEAKAAGALNHPNLVTIFELGTHEGQLFLVMELIEGETLRARLARDGEGSPSSTGVPGSAAGSSASGAGPALPTRKIVDYGIQIAQGLAAAHEKGIVHRDLKPENVLITPRGQAKILDFGLAKLIESSTAATSHIPTAIADTDPGTVLGTVEYMSPEQVRGEEVDQRSDIFSLGVILYEMLSGRRVFQRDSSAETMSAILREDPASLSGEHSRISPVLDRILRRCLEKERTERFNSGQDLAFALEAIRDASTSDLRPLEAVAGRGRGKGWLLGVGAVVLLGLGFLLGGLRSGGTGASGAVTAGASARLMPLTFDAGREVQPTISPDGQAIVYVAQSTPENPDLFYRQVGGETAINLTPDSPQPDTQPAFSPDGRWIAFRSEREGGGIFLVGATGGSVRRVTDFGYNPSWSPDGKELVIGLSGIAQPYGRGAISALWRVAVDGGDTTRIAGTGDAAQPSWSPGGNRIAYWGLPAGTGQRVLYTVSAQGGEPVALTDDDAFNWSPRWSGDGRYLYFASNRGGEMNIWRLPIDETTGRAQGSPEPVIVSTERCGMLDVSRGTNRVVFSSTATSFLYGRVAFDPATMKVHPDHVDTLYRGSDGHNPMTLSPDGEWILYRQTAPYEDILVSSLDGKTVRRLTKDRFKDRQPTWSADSRRIWFHSDRSGTYQIWSVRRDGSDLRQELVYRGEGIVHTPHLSPDGKRCVVLWDHGNSGIFDCSVPVAQRNVEWLPEVEPGVDFYAGAWSPDGTHIVGQTQTVQGEVLPGILVYAPETRKYVRLTDEGMNPGWLPDSRTILYWNKGALWRVDLETRKPVLVYRDTPGMSLDGDFASWDGRWILFETVHSEANIWMVAQDAGEPAS